MKSDIQIFESEYSSVKEGLSEDPSNFTLLKKAAFISLFLGRMDEAYHWSASLDSYDALYSQSTRQKRILLFQGISSGDTDYETTQGIFYLPRKNSRHDESPSEDGIWNDNPQRESLIKTPLSWSDAVHYRYKILSRSPIRKIKEGIAPFSYEPGSMMNYQGVHKDIPRKIIGYWYYSGFIHLNERVIPAAFRLPEFPTNDQELDFFTEEDITNEINGGEQITCYFSQKPEPLNEWIECKIRMHSIFSRSTQQFGSANSFYQGHEGWKLPGQRPTLERIRAYSLEKWISKDHEILDIGCNIGMFGIELSRHITRYTGFDANPDLIEIAQTLSNHKRVDNCDFINTDFNHFLEINNGKKFDFIFSFAVHGWIGTSLDEYARILRNLTKPGGLVLLESHDVTDALEEKKFVRQMSHLIKSGLMIRSRGKLMDDGKRKRMFYIFQNNEKKP